MVTMDISVITSEQLQQLKLSYNTMWANTMMQAVLKAVAPMTEINSRLFMNTQATPSE